MAELSMIILLLANGGHWFGGREAWVELGWRLPDVSPTVMVEWSLGRDEWRLMDGTAPLVGGAGTARMTMQLPKVRAVTDVTWRYTLREAATGQVLETGERAVRLYPPVITADMLPVSDGDWVVVGPAECTVARALDQAGVRFRRQDSAPQLAGQRRVYVIVARERDLSALEQASLLSLAEGGGRIMVLGSGVRDDWFGYALAAAPAPRTLGYHGTVFSPAAVAVLDAWVPGVTGDVTAVRLGTTVDRADGTWPVLDDAPPSHALAVMRVVGAGAILLAPWPLDDEVNDPRAQLLLRSGLNALRTLAPGSGATTEAEAEIPYAR